MDKSWSQVDLIREAFHYQSRFAGSTMVFKIDFPVTEDPGFPYLMKDLALLAQTGFRVVIVPGAKEWIDSVLREYGIVSGYAGSIRITTEAAIPFVEMAAFHVATRFMTGLAASRVDAVIGNFVRAQGLGILNGADMAHTGTVKKILSEPVRRALENGMVPILPCIGWSASGKPYNVPSDEIALAASAALGAVKLFILSLENRISAGAYVLPDTISRDEQGRISRLSIQEAGAILEKNWKENDKGLDEISLALKAARTGVERVQLVDAREEGAVLRELFSNLGSGTMIYSDEYEAIRPLKTGDIPDVLRLMEPLMHQGVLVRRSAGDIQEKKADYAVFAIDGSIHASGALHDWGEDQGEIAAVSTDPAYADLGLGRRIVRYLIDRAGKQGLRRVFVLTTRTQDWFELLGFKEVSVESLPEKKRLLYDRNRNSKIFALDIGSRQ
ncbi:MAG: amino-acid N-acetyltransferase [Treponema sp.]|jgi:amino-acid N-acetyltransferase|nr:amino-acid N-acetyltransferase [Treponema sp.]